MDLFKLSAKKLENYLDTVDSSLFPELGSLRRLSKAKSFEIVLKEASKVLDDIEKIPVVNEKLYKSFAETGKRDIYLQPHDQRRINLSVATFYQIIGKKDYKSLIESYIKAICEEQTWVVPPHEGRLIDIYSVSTAFELAEIITIFSDLLDLEIINLVKQKIEERIFKPYIDNLDQHSWYQSHDNWNAVCNSAIGSIFLLVENDLERKAKAIQLVLKGLEVYLEKSFYDDGSTNEGIGYWDYGISWFTIFSEALFIKSNKKLDLINSTNKIQKIVQYPAAVQVSSKKFLSFSDLNDEVNFNPGIIQKLSERTRNPLLLNLITEPIKIEYLGISTILRFIFWWDGKTYKQKKFKDSFLPDASIIKFSVKPITVAVKGGNNAENHNHNDIGSFIINIDGEDFITDPGAGVYNKDYFNENRYQNIFANSYGHSVPRVNEKLQSQGLQFSGKIVQHSFQGGEKSATIEFANAYDEPNLEKLTRKIVLKSSQEIIFEDIFDFVEMNNSIEEVFITWLNAKINDNRNEVLIENDSHILVLSSENEELNFQIEYLDKESKYNEKEKVLKRITLTINNPKRIVINMRVEKKLK